MKDVWSEAERYRQPDIPGYKSAEGDRYGIFAVPYKGYVTLYCMVSDGDAKAAGLSDEWRWEHVSVSTKNRTPNWYEMDFIKDLFWKED